VNVSQSLETYAQTPEVVQPADRALDYPAGHTESAAVRLATTCDLSRDALCVQHTTVLVVVVAAITLNERWLGKWTAALAANRRDRLDERDQLRNVVAVGTGQNHRERDALRFGDEVVFGAGASAIGGIGSCF